MKRNKALNSRDFVTILEQCEVPFKNMGYEGILNMMSLYYDAAALDAARSGFDQVAKSFIKRSVALYAALDKIGFYE